MRNVYLCFHHSGGSHLVKFSDLRASIAMGAQPNGGQKKPSGQTTVKALCLTLIDLYASFQLFIYSMIYIVFFLSSIALKSVKSSSQISDLTFISHNFDIIWIRSGCKSLQNFLEIRIPEISAKLSFQLVKIVLLFRDNYILAKHLPIALPLDR